MSKTGECVAWIPDRGFGFIKPDDGGSDVFAHTTKLEGAEELNIGERVTFDIVYDDKTGKDRAENISGDGSGQPAEKRGGDRDRGGYGRSRRDRDYDRDDRRGDRDR